MKNPIRYPHIFALALCVSLFASAEGTRSSTTVGASTTPSTQPAKTGGCASTSNLAGSLGLNVGDQSTTISTNCTQFAAQQPIPCPDQGVNWGSGNVCAGTASATQHSSNKAVTNTTTKYTGTATFQCVNGAYYITGTPTCTYVPDNCPGRTLGWGANGCSGAILNTTHGNNRNVNNTAQDRAGSATYSCDDGSYTEQPGSTCDKINQPCAGQGVNWGGNCTGTTPNIVHNSTNTVTNTTSNYVGSAVYSCNNSVLNYSSGSCNVATCSATSVSWGAGCTANLPVGNHGANTPTSSTASSHTGNATYACTNGSYSLNSGSSCRAYNTCAAGSSSWGPNNYCAGSYSALGHGQSQNFGNSRTGYTGGATASCSDGTLTFSNQSCGGNPCTSSRTTWASGSCGGNVPTIDSGTSTTVTNDQSGYTGSAGVSCEGAVLTASGSPTCNANPCTGTFLSWGGNCGANFPSTASSTTQSRGNVFTGYTGGADFQCFAGSWAYASGYCTANPCDAQRGTWASCGANVPALNSGQTSSPSNDVGGYSGSATFSCNAGSLSASGESCSANACPASRGNWGSCGVNVPQLNSGQSANYGSDVAGYSGSATFSCSAGTRSISNDSCSANSCPSTTLSWGDGCSAAATNTASGQAPSLTNSAANRTGSATFSCTTGNWAYQSGSCQRTDNGCPGGPYNWGGSCSGNYPNMNHTDNLNVGNNTANYTGTANLTCSNGAVSLGANSCAPTTNPCPGGTFNWGGSCSAPYGQIAHGNASNIANNSSGFDGAITLSCNNGAVSPSAASCSEKPPASFSTFGNGHFARAKPTSGENSRLVYTMSFFNNGTFEAKAVPSGANQQFLQVNGANQPNAKITGTWITQVPVADGAAAPYDVMISIVEGVNITAIPTNGAADWQPLNTTRSFSTNLQFRTDNAGGEYEADVTIRIRKRSDPSKVTTHTIELLVIVAS